MLCLLSAADKFLLMEPEILYAVLVCNMHAAHPSQPHPSSYNYSDYTEWRAEITGTLWIMNWWDYKNQNRLLGNSMWRWGLDLTGSGQGCKTCFWEHGKGLTASLKAGN